MFFELLLYIIVAGICGSIAKALTGYSPGGCLVSVVVGFIGALIGGKLSQLANLPKPYSIGVGDRELPILWAIIGGTVFLAVLGLVTRGGKRGR
jgi:uncharacterized membrane protein YeaQ/YmgE (transglycosylase-associated protein family)